MSRSASEQASKGGKAQAAAIKLREVRRDRWYYARPPLPPPWSAEEQDTPPTAEFVVGHARAEG
jgi:hypothetical protein